MRRVLVGVVVLLFACSGPEETPETTTPTRIEESGADGDDLSVEPSGAAVQPAPDRLEVVEHDEACRPLDARGEGGCDAILGTFWQGSRCVQISGCRCVGENCDDGFGSIEECEELYEHCR